MKRWGGFDPYGFYSGMVYDHRDLSGFVGSKVGAKLQSNYQDYRDQRAKQQQQERAGLPVDAEDPFNGAEEMLFGLMDGLRRTEESFGNLFSGNGFNTDADLNNMDWETYDGYMKITENMAVQLKENPRDISKEDMAEYLQAKMRSGQELAGWEKNVMVGIASEYSRGTIKANFKSDTKYETNRQIASVDRTGYNTAGLKNEIGQMRAEDKYYKSLKQQQLASYHGENIQKHQMAMFVGNLSKAEAFLLNSVVSNLYGAKQLYDKTVMIKDKLTEAVDEKLAGVGVMALPLKGATSAAAAKVAGVFSAAVVIGGGMYSANESKKAFDSGWDYYNQAVQYSDAFKAAMVNPAGARDNLFIHPETNVPCHTPTKTKPTGSRTGTLYQGEN